MKYFLILVGALVLAVVLGAWIIRRRRDAQEVRRAEHARLKAETARLASRLRYADTTLQRIDEQVRLFAETDHVLAGAINPIVFEYFRQKLETSE